MTQPGKYEQMVSNEFDCLAGHHTVASVRTILKRDAVMLLHRQRAALVRLINKQYKELNPTLATTDWGKGYLEASNNFLAALARYKKGTP